MDEEAQDYQGAGRECFHFPWQLFSCAGKLEFMRVQSTEYRVQSAVMEEILTDFIDSQGCVILAF